MIYPSADTIEQRVGSRYSLVVLAAKRAKQIKEGAPVLIDTASTNPLTIALEEIAAGKVTIGEAPPVIETKAAISSEESVPAPAAPPPPVMSRVAEPIMDDAEEEPADDELTEDEDEDDDADAE